MLFHEPAFLLAFLPACLLVFHVLRRYTFGGALISLLAFSLLFYAWWKPPYLILLIVSIALNYGAARLIIKSDGKARRNWLILGVAFNLGLIGVFKYLPLIGETMGFMGGAFNIAAAGPPYSLPELILPIGISFYTFQQIAFLADVHAGITKLPPLRRYGLFVSFFPQLIAGPIVHHAEMMPQLRRENYSVDLTKVTEGMFFFAAGLFKKVVIADGIAIYANRFFTLDLGETAVSTADAWLGALAYSLQLYFDFSGYSDMAIGLALMFGVRLPINFASPYKADSIIDFWRRWHITLSRFLRDYLYIPLGGNRRGRPRRYLNLFITMLLGGLWHGAGWTFVFWGGLHGVFLALNHGWNALLKGLGLKAVTDNAAGYWIGRLATFALVVIAWVPFRAESIAFTTAAWRAMFGLAGEDSGKALYAFDGGWPKPLEWLAAPVDFNLLTVPPVLWIFLALVIAWFAPNTQQFARWCGYRSDGAGRNGLSLASPLRSTVFVSAFALFVFAAASRLINAGAKIEFLYFQF